MRHWERGDPLEVLIRRGEDCTGCVHLSTWRIDTSRFVECVNVEVVRRIRDQAPMKRCEQWKHKGAGD